MGWLKLDDGFDEDPKIEKLGIQGAWFFLCSLTYCGRNYESRGFIPATRALVLAAIPKPKHVIARLVELGLWTPEVLDGVQGYRVTNWTRHQPERDPDRVTSESERKRRYNAARTENARESRGARTERESENARRTRNETRGDRAASLQAEEELEIVTPDDNKRLLFSTGPEPNAPSSRQAPAPSAPHGSSDQEKPNASPPDQPRPVVADVVADQDKRPPAPSSSDPGRAARWRLLDAIADAAVKRQRSLPEGVRNEDAYRSGVIAETLRESGALVDSVADAHQNASKPELLSRFNAALSRSHLSPKRLTALEAEEATGRANRARDEANAQAEAQQAAAAQQRRDAVARARAELGPERCEELRAKAEEELLAAGDPMARSGARSTLRAMRIGAATDELILAAVGERTAAEPDRSPNMTNPRRLQAVSA